jgi:hypothetical protein
MRDPSDSYKLALASQVAMMSVSSAKTIDSVPALYIS